MTHTFNYFILVSFLIGFSLPAQAQSLIKEVGGPVGILPIISEPAAKLIVDAPIKEQLQSGKLIIKYRAENLRIVPVYGQAALDISPRVGHIHITVDDAPWHWADASNEPIIIVGLKEGPHRILIELADATHKVIDRKTVMFTIPKIKQAIKSHHQ